jgi:FkbM family methyltransferase
MMLWFENWRDVFDGYRGRRPWVPLRLRRGLVIHHSIDDQVIFTFDEVFRDRSYRRGVNESNEGVMVDLGANIGMVTLDWMSRLNRVTIHAYEPYPRTFETLAANVAANDLSKRIRIYNEAVSGRAGTLVLHASGGSMLTSAYRNCAHLSESVQVQVEAVTLDQVVARCAGRGPISLIKMDVEGAEADVMEAASKQSLEEVRQFVLEYHDHLCPNARSRCESVLTGAGFYCQVRPLSNRQGILYATRH